MNFSKVVEKWRRQRHDYSVINWRKLDKELKDLALFFTYFKHFVITNRNFTQGRKSTIKQKSCKNIFRIIDWISEEIKVVMENNIHDSDQPNPEDINFVGKLVEELKSQGIFDQIRSDCLGEVDSRVSYRKFSLTRIFTDFAVFSRLIKILNYALRAQFHAI